MNKVYDIDLTYITARGPGTVFMKEMIKVSGITTNMGVHFFDLLIYLVHLRML